MKTCFGRLAAHTALLPVVFAAALVSLDGGVVSAAVLRVGSVADERFGTSWTLDGSSMQNTRAKLQNPANFGTAGTAHFSITINDTAATPGSLTLALLKNFDVFFIGYLNDNSSNALTAAELANLHTWVNAGGVLIVTCDESGYDAVCADFGHPATTSATNPMVPTGLGVLHPIFNGLFGAVPTFNMRGTQGYFSATAGATVLAQDSTPGTPHPVFLTKTEGAGRVILFADVDIIANALTSDAAITNSNDRLLGNLFAYAAGILPPVRVGSVANSRFNQSWTLDGS